MDIQTKIEEDLRIAQEQRREIDVRIEELGAALRVIQRYNPKEPVSQPTQKRDDRHGHSLTIAEKCVGVLRAAYPQGLGKADIIAAIAQRYGDNIKPNTLTTTLSRTRDKTGHVRNDNKIWHYVPESNEAPERGPQSSVGSSPETAGCTAGLFHPGEAKSQKGGGNGPN